MKVPFSHRLRQLVKKAQPLPLMMVGFVLGLILSALLSSDDSVPALAPLPLRSAFGAAVACELPVALAIALAGLTRLPQLPGLPLFCRSLWWGYGSLRMYASMGRSALYFQYALGNGLTLLPLCCMAKIAAECAQGYGPLRGSRLYDYLCRCLFYFGLVLLTLPLRLYGG